MTVTYWVYVAVQRSIMMVFEDPENVVAIGIAGVVRVDMKQLNLVGYLNFNLRSL